MTRLTFYPQPVAESGPVSYECARQWCHNVSPDRYCAECSPRLGMVRHGYTLRDLDLLTHGALKADRLMALDYADRKDIAWSAIAEYLCAAEKAPTRIELIQVGWQAIYRTVREGYRQRGSRDGDVSLDGAPTMSRFAQYWQPGLNLSLEERVVERVAVAQIFAELSDTDRDALDALALADDYAKAADLLGCNYKAAVARINTARKHVRALWHEWETPRPVTRTDRRVASHTAELATHCGNDHEWTPENTRMANTMKNGKPHRRRFCRQCERDRYVRRAAS